MPTGVYNHKPRPKEVYLKVWATRRQNGTDKISDIGRKNLSISHKGNVSGNKGKKHPQLCGDGNVMRRPEVVEKLKNTPGNRRTRFNKGHVPFNKGKHHLVGEKHWNFQNWKSKEPYNETFSPELKELVRKNYQYRCQECFRHENELFYKNGKSYNLVIHHIDYDKKNSNPDNLIPLCRSCHTQTNYGRADWQKYFKEKVKSC